MNKLQFSAINDFANFIQIKYFISPQFATFSSHSKQEKNVKILQPPRGKKLNSFSENSSIKCFFFFMGMYAH